MIDADTLVALVKLTRLAFVRSPSSQIVVVSCIDSCVEEPSPILHRARSDRRFGAVTGLLTYFVIVSGGSS